MMDRRDFVKLALTVAPASAATSCSSLQSKRLSGVAQRRVLVMAFDGLHPDILSSLMQKRRLPNFQRLARQGSFRRLKTCMPPHTPVAFSNIISGADAGLHQVFDFIHRDPHPVDDRQVVMPYFSTANVEQPEQQWTISLGGWELPLAGATTRLLRRGPAFWDSLVAAGIDTDIYYLPANYPPPTPQGPGRFRAISGMGTPDVNGTYGEFTFLTFNTTLRGRRVDGGKFVRLTMFGDRGSAAISGPTNHLRRADEQGRREKMKLVVEVVRDPERRVARITIAGQSVLLNESEWSDWIPVAFNTGIPGSNLLGAMGGPTMVSGMVRVFLKQVHPHVEIYVSPVNIDPLNAVMPFTSPPTFAQELATQHGRFYTTGIPEDTKALSHGVLNEDQFLAQVDAVHHGRVDQFRSALAEFKQGCLFFYFGSTDLLQHMFWRDQDPAHPGWTQNQADQYGSVIEDVYESLDKLIGEALDHLHEEDLLLVLSDHGFDSFRRGFNLNSWLVENQYIDLIRPEQQGRHELFSNVNWSRTMAYGLGMNGLYLNQVGRERHGIVNDRKRTRTLEELRERLLGVHDKDGVQVIDRVDLVEDLYSGADPLVAPDLIIGYNSGYRASWETVLGKMPREILVDNLERWSGTHLINPDHVPGILLTNFEVARHEPELSDIAPTILNAFAIGKPTYMTGRPLQKET